MTQKEFLQKVSDVAQVPKQDTKKVLEALAAVGRAYLVGGEEVPLPSLGKLKPAKRSARRGRNPHTGEIIEIAAQNTARFAPSAPLKRQLNEGQSLEDTVSGY